MLSQQDQLDEAANYITQLKGRVDELQKKMEKVKGGNNTCSRNPNSTKNSDTKTETLGVKLPIVELQDFDSNIEVSVISGVDKNFMLYEIISILQDEGADVVTANTSSIGDKIFYTIHAQVSIVIFF